jgi:hypothetical protein
MRLIYAQGFSKAEKEEWRAIIFNNLLTAFRVILDAMEDTGIEFEHESNNVCGIGDISCVARNISLPTSRYQTANAVFGE